MKYQTKSIILGRKKRESKEDDDYPCFISLFDVHNPHTSGEVPKQILDFPHTHKVIIKGLEVNYLLGGNDLVIDNLQEIELVVDNGHIYLTGKQEKS
jgi:hypothetical protein